MEYRPRSLMRDGNLLHLFANIYSRVLLNLVWAFTVFTSVSSMSIMGRPECQPVQLPMCSTMPYNLTRMPNLLHHSTQENAKLAIEQFSPLVQTNCSGNLTFFLCAMYAPICTMGFMEEPVPPCKSVCQEVRAGCEPVMMRYNVSWPAYLSCEQFPEYTSGVCITREAIVDSSPTTEEMSATTLAPQPTPGICATCPHDHELTKELYFQKEYEYVVRARVEGFSASHQRGNDMYVTVTVEHVIKFSEIFIPEGEVLLWVNNHCACPEMTSGVEYMIMCYQDIINGRLVLEDDCLAVPWHNKYTRKVKKWDQKLIREQRDRDNSETRSNRRYRDIYYLYGI